MLRSRFVYLPSGSGKWEDVGESWRAAAVLGTRRGSRTGSTTGVPSTTTTGRPGGRCCRRTSSRPCDETTLRRPSGPGCRGPGTTWRDWWRCGRSPTPRSSRRRSARGRPPRWPRCSPTRVSTGCARSRPPTAASRSSATPPRRTARRRCSCTPTTTCSRPGTSPRGAPRRGTLTERDGRWYGRGAADCKGNLVMLLSRPARPAAAVAGRHPGGLRGVGGDVDRRPGGPRAVRAGAVRRGRDGDRGRRQHRARHPDGHLEPARDRQRGGHRRDPGRARPLRHVRRRRTRRPGRAGVDAGDPARRRRRDDDQGTGCRWDVDRRRLPGRAVPRRRRRPRRRLGPRLGLGGRRAVGAAVRQRAGHRRSLGVRARAPRSSTPPGRW